MKEIKPTKIIIITGFSFILIMIGALTFYLSKKNQAHKNYSLDQYSAIIKGVKKVKSLWFEGADHESWNRGVYNCPNNLGPWKNVNSSYLRCNPGFLECYFDKNKMIEVRSNNGKKFQFTLKKEFKDRFGVSSRYRIVTRSSTNLSNLPNYGVLLTLENVKDKSLNQKFILEDLCHEAFLPQRVYGVGKYEDSKTQKTDWRFDNYNRNIMLDKHLVSNRDILDWIRFGDGPKDLEKKIRQKILASPATNLLPTQMESYCNFLGKTLLKAEYFDAATFHPGELDIKKIQKKTPRGPYPWTRKVESGFLYNAAKNNNFKMTSNHCKKAYTIDCFKIRPFIHYERTSTSWTGIFDILGGYPEYLKNIVHPNKNLKASSFYLPVNSNWHKLGKRSFWDGISFGHKNFTHGVFPELSVDYEVAFRCQREVYVKK